MSSKDPPGSTADFFQVEFENGDLCGHPHRSIEHAARCLQKTNGVAVVAMKKRRDSVNSARLYNRDRESLSKREVHFLIEWTKIRRYRSAVMPPESA